MVRTMEEEVVVSFVIPVYNAEKFLLTAVQSILCNQTYAVEIILVNDGSKDDSLALCRKLERKNPCVKCVSIPNGGAGHARNVGIDLAVGKWVAFLDSDDLILGSFFSQPFLNMLTKAYENNTEIIYTPKILCDFFLKETPKFVYPEDLESIRKQHFIPAMEFWSCIYRRDFLNRENVRFFEYQCQDVESAFRFRAFSRTERIQIDRKHIFYVHRDNPASNVNTWNVNVLLSIKAKVFFELFLEYRKEDAETRNWLYLQYLYYSKSLAVRGWKNGMTEKDCQCLKELISIDSNIRKMREIPTRYRCIEAAINALCRSSIGWKLYCKHGQKKNSKRSGSKTSVEIPKDETHTLLKRLKDYERMAECEVKSDE